MKCELRITGGARSGHREMFEKPYIGVGRHPMSDLRFDAEKDIDASTRHAAIIQNGDLWILRDLGSTNGTYVNGEKITGERQLKDGDQLRFGVHGPEASFHVLREEGEEVIMPAVKVEPRPSAASPSAASSSAASSSAASPSADPRQKKQVAKTTPEKAIVRERETPVSKTGVLRAEIAAQQSRYRGLAIALILVVLGALGIVVWQGRTSDETITRVANQRDSVIGELAALRRLQASTDSQKAQLEIQLRAEQDPRRQRVIQARIDTASRRSAAIQQAREVDYTAIMRANNAGVAAIFVRFASDTTRAYTGTAFSLNAQGQMITNKHVVMTGNEAPLEIAIQFSGSNDVHPARLVRVAPDADLALVQLESAGPFPFISGVSQTPVTQGAPIALIGYPGGGPRATLVTGSVTRVVPDSLIELDAFSGVGASGSPIFDRDGRVIGVEFGGIVGSGGRQILGLPIARAMRLLN